MLIAGIFLIPVFLDAQVKRNEDILDLIEKGDKAYSHEDYLKALNFFKEAGEKSGNDPDIEKRLGVTLFKLNQYKDAMPVLESVRAQSDSTDIYVDYYLAISLHKLEKYDEAINMYESCLEYINTKSVETGEEEIKKRIAQCKFWKKISESSLDVTIKRLDTTINTSAPEYGAKVIGDSMMLFTSRRMSAIPIADLIMKPDEDVFISKLSGNKKWQQAEKIGNNINTSLNNAVLDVSSDGKRVFFYNDINSGDILASKFNGKFSLPDTLKGQLNSVEFTESAFTINASGDKCYFVSNRTDVINQGGKDIFEATKNSGGTWGNVKNLGATINSKYNEDFVFWSDEDTALYFSSNRENSVGGYDIFVSKTSPNGELLPPKNIGLPINTPFDDISFFKVGNKAWYSTTFQNNKEDIFEIQFNYDVYNPDWDTTSMEGITRIDEFNVINNVYFKTGKSRVNRRDSVFLHLVDVLKNIDGAKIKLSGHSDWIGDEKINDKLSFERAVNLAEALMENGVDPKILTLDFYGETHLQTDTSFVNDSLKEFALAKNRYVDISIVKQGTPYLYVKKVISENNNNPNGIKYGVMVYISDKSYKEFSKAQGVIESYSEASKQYFYHTKYYDNILGAKTELDVLIDAYEGAYLFFKK